MKPNSVTLFWFVWNPRGNAPTHRHYRLMDAQAEAKRLAAQCPGQQFLILRSVGGFQLPSPEPMAIAIDDGLPF